MVIQKLLYSIVISYRSSWRGFTLVQGRLTKSWLINDIILLLSIRHIAKGFIMGLLESRSKLHTEYFNNLDDVVKANS